ncbi:MAG TPA: MnmC family methyltransferase [Opitutaceae bacterium]|nr:MnmC family methyltransferase [Opitutaceae bacterium]
MSDPYELVRLANGTFSLRSIAEGETFHPVIGPIAEAEALYIRQLRLRERATHPAGPGTRQDAGGTAESFVIWDVGLGAGGNVLTTLHRLKEVPAHLHIVSFDHTLGALRFAMEHAAALQFPIGLESVLEELLRARRAEFRHGALHVRWEIHIGDFPHALAAAGAEWPAPHAIFFDAFSPARNPAMWTLPLFVNLFRRLDPQRPCALATYSRSTIPRVTLLLAGFFVGAGEPVAEKDETTVASNSLALIERPLGARWLERARASHSAEPLHTNEYRIEPLAPDTWERLRAHPQFQREKTAEGNGPAASG